MSDRVTQGVLHGVRHMKRNRQTTAAKAATNTKTIKLPAQTLENAAAQSGRTPAEEVARTYQTLTGRKAEARHIGTKNGVAAFEIAAQGAAKGNGMWRTTTRKGQRVLIEPHGHAYHGTAQEVRDAALTPNSRKGLAQSIQFARYVAEHFKYTPEQRREYVREKRRDAIKTQEQFVLFGEPTTIPADVEIVASAAARYMGQTFDAFVRDALFAAIDKAIDKAEKDAGEIGVGLPLTRYERAALDRIKATRPQIEAEAKARLAARATA